METPFHGETPSGIHETPEGKTPIGRLQKEFVLTRNRQVSPTPGRRKRSR